MDAPTSGRILKIAGAAKELLAEHTFERLDLCADRRLGDAELRRSFGQAALLRDHPKITQMVVVQEFHRSMFFHLNLKVQLGNRISRSRHLHAKWH